MQKIKDLAKALYHDRKVRFLFVGVLNTIVGYGAYALFIYLKMHYLVAQLLSSFIGIMHSYLWNKYFTFKSPEKSVAEVVRFVSVYAAGYLINMGILYVSIEKFRMNAYLSGILCLFVTTVLSYVGHKKISFRAHKTERKEIENEN